MKKIITLFCFLFFNFSLIHAQAWLWAKEPLTYRGGGGGDPLADHSIAVDVHGNAYQTALFGGHLVYNQDTIKTQFGSAPYLAKYNPNGSPIWAKQGLLTSGGGSGYGIAVSTDGAYGIYEVGYFTDSLKLGTYKLFNPNGDDPYIVKYDTNGNVIWAKQGVLKERSSADAESVVSDKSGNTYMLGFFTDTIAFGSDTLKTIANKDQVFLVKYDSSGNVKWARQSTGTSDDFYSYGQLSVALDKDEHVYVTGNFTDTMVFGTDSVKARYVLHTFFSSIKNAFLVKYDSSGNVLWATQSQDMSSASDGMGISVAVDGSNNPYISGDFTDTIILDKDTLTNTFDGHNDFFVAKYDTNGHLIWAIPGTAVNAHNDWITFAITCDTLKRGGGYVTISGTLGNPLKVAFKSDTLGLAVGTELTILFQFDSAGNVKCINSFGEGGEDEEDGVAVSPTGEYIYVGGDIWTSTIIGPDTLTHGADYPFVARWKTCCGAPVTVSPLDTTICSGASVMLKAGGAATYGWSPPVGLNKTTGDTVISIPTATTHYTVTGQNLTCAATAIATIIVNPLPTINITPPQDSICTGSLTVLTASGASSYVWKPTSGLSCTTCSNPGANPVVTTPYTVVGTDINHCVDSATINLVVSNKPVIVLKEHPANDSICNGDSAHLYVSGGTKYLWTPGNMNQDSVWVKPASNGTYTVVVDNNGCPGDTTLNVYVSPAINATITPSGTICFGDSMTLTATGGGTYKWSNNSTNNTIKVGPTGNTNYSVMVKNQVCYDSAKTTVTVDVPAISVCCSDTITTGSSTTLNASGTGNFVWTPSAGLNCTTCGNPTASPTVTTTYTITSNDANNCSLERTLTVYVENSHCADFVVPNTFTPNNDGINDDFVINADSTTAYNITIYDRWGKQVYTSGNPTEYWNGRINSTENLVPDGTYYYEITASCGSHDYNKKGFVEVIGEK